MALQSRHLASWAWSLLSMSEILRFHVLRLGTDQRGGHSFIRRRDKRSMREHAPGSVLMTTPESVRVARAADGAYDIHLPLMQWPVILVNVGVPPGRTIWGLLYAGFGQKVDVAPEKIEVENVRIRRKDDDETNEG